MLQIVAIIKAIGQKYWRELEKIEIRNVAVRIKSDSAT